MYKKHLNVIDENAKFFCNISDALWDHPELPFEEYEASKLISNYLEEQGFTIERNVAGLPTAFKATFELIEKAKAEHRQKTGGIYHCPIPDDVKPAIPKLE